MFAIIFSFSVTLITGMKILIFFFVALLLYSTGNAQKQLALVKQNKIIVRITEGEFIRFKRKDRDHFTRGFIGGIHQDYFRIGEDTTYLYDVAAIDLRNRPNSGFKVRQTGIMLIVTGVAVVLIDAFNSHSVDSGVATVSGSLIATGIFMQFVNNDIFKIGRKKRIITMGG